MSSSLRADYLAFRSFDKSLVLGGGVHLVCVMVSTFHMAGDCDPSGALSAKHGGITQHR